MTEEERSLYELEYVQDQNDPVWAVIFMKRRIQQVTEMCDDECSSTDIYIAAALAQNGPGFISDPMISLMAKKNLINVGGVTIRWKDYFDEPRNADDTMYPLRIFSAMIVLLRNRGWSVPGIYWNTIQTLSNTGD